jgi:hypothetical protein
MVAQHHPWFCENGDYSLAPLYIKWFCSTTVNSYSMMVFDHHFTLYMGGDCSPFVVGEIYYGEQSPLRSYPRQSELVAENHPAGCEQV